MRPASFQATRVCCQGGSTPSQPIFVSTQGVFLSEQVLACLCGSGEQIVCVGYYQKREAFRLTGVSVNRSVRNTVEKGSVSV